MSRSDVSRSEIGVTKNYANSHRRHKGFIVFCETKLRYEKGFKAWIFLGPYLIGVLGLETMITENAKFATAFWPWLGFLAYLILFPLAWRRVLTLVALKKAAPVVPLR